MTKKKVRREPKSSSKSVNTKISKSIPISEKSVDVKEKKNFKGKLSHSYPTETKRGKKLTSPLSGGGMVTFFFKKKSYEQNEKDAVRLLKFYRKHIMTYQVVKAWHHKGTIKNQVDSRTGAIIIKRKKTQGWAGKNKIVGYSTGRTPNQINTATINYLVRETQISVKAALAGMKQQYGKSVAILFKPASFTERGSRFEFAINIFFDAKGLQFFKQQNRLVK